MPESKSKKGEECFDCCQIGDTSCCCMVSFMHIEIIVRQRATFMSRDHPFFYRAYPLCPVVVSDWLKGQENMQSAGISHVSYIKIIFFDVQGDL